MVWSSECYVPVLVILLLVPYSIPHEEQLSQKLREMHCDNSWHQGYNHHSNKRNICSEMPKSVDYEVFGRVQGVFFRKFTAKRAKELGLKGYVMNTRRGTVMGVMQGNHDEINEMKHWLRTTGSPSSAIDRCEFKNEKSISSMEFNDFSIHH